MTKNGIIVFAHWPYSPDPAFADDYLFSKIKAFLKGLKVQLAEVKEAIIAATKEDHSESPARLLPAVVL
jgi:hypothetical protein